MASFLACTTAVEEVVTRHRQGQLQYLEQVEHEDARRSVVSIVADETAHLAFVVREGRRCPSYGVMHKVVRGSTEAVIWLDMRL